MAGTGREEWRKRVERWRDSGLSAAEFATETGINPRTLTWWKSALSREAHTQQSPPAAPHPATTVAQARPARARPKRTDRAPLIELRAGVSDSRFELELGQGRKLWVPSRFDADALRRLLQVVGTTT